MNRFTPEILRFAQNDNREMLHYETIRFTPEILRFAQNDNREMLHYEMIRLTRRFFASLRMTIKECPDKYHSIPSVSIRSHPFQFVSIRSHSSLLKRGCFNLF